MSTILGILELPNSVSLVRRYWGVDTIAVEVDARLDWASEAVIGKWMYLPLVDPTAALSFLIESVEYVEQAGPHTLKLNGRTIDGIATQARIIVPDAGDDYDTQTGAAETVMKHYVDHNAITAVDSDRDVPGLVLASDGARGGTVTYNGRYQRVVDVLLELGYASGLGWLVSYRPDLDQHTFDVLQGVDHTADVFFDFDLDTMNEWDELASTVNAVSSVLVAGQGVGSARDVVIRPSSSPPVGLDRREGFIDARDVTSGDLTSLEQRGDAVLMANAPQSSLTVDPNLIGSFKYGVDFNLGDLVTVRNLERNVSRVARIIEVHIDVTTSAAVPVISIVLDKPVPTTQSATGGDTLYSGATADTPVPVAASAGVPIGVVVPFAGSTAPDDWLMCDGAAVSRTTYADLFTTIGTAFGAGDGSTTFNLPDMRQRFPLGVAASGTGSSLGDAGGAIDHTHTQPTHTHASAAHAHTFTTTHTHSSAAHTHTGPSHTHTSAAHSHGLSSAGWAQVSVNTTGVQTNTLTGVASWTRNRAVEWGSPSTPSGSTFTEGIALDGATDSATPGSTGASGTAATGSTTPGSTGDSAPGSTDSATPGVTSASGADTTGAANAPFLALNYIIRAA